MPIHAAADISLPLRLMSLFIFRAAATPLFYATPFAAATLRAYVYAADAAYAAAIFFFDCRYADDYILRFRLLRCRYFTCSSITDFADITSAMLRYARFYVAACRYY